MRRGVPWLLIGTLVLLPAAAAVAGTAAFGSLRREAIQAVNACRNLATVSKQVDGLTGEVLTETVALKQGSTSRIAVVRERLDVVEGKVGELRTKTEELQLLAASIEEYGKDLQAP